MYPSIFFFLLLDNLSRPSWETTLFNNLPCLTTTGYSIDATFVSLFPYGEYRSLPGIVFWLDFNRHENVDGNRGIWWKIHKCRRYLNWFWEASGDRKRETLLRFGACYIKEKHTTILISILLFRYSRFIQITYKLTQRFCALLDSLWFMSAIDINAAYIEPEILCLC